MMGRNDMLEPLVRQRRAKRDRFLADAISRNTKPQRRAGLPYPQFGRIHAMPMAALARAQQEQNRRPRPAPAFLCRITPRLAVMPTLRMRREIQRRDHRRGRQ